MDRYGFSEDGGAYFVIVLPKDPEYREVAEQGSLPDEVLRPKQLEEDLTPKTPDTPYGYRNNLLSLEEQHAHSTETSHPAPAQPGGLLALTQGEVEELNKSRAVDPPPRYQYLIPTMINEGLKRAFPSRAANEHIERWHELEKNTTSNERRYDGGSVPASQCMSSEDLSLRQDELREQERQVRAEFRRTTLSVQQQRSIGSNNLFMLIDLLSEGVKVRRHQQQKQAEYVRLFSSDECLTIVWEPLHPTMEHTPSASEDDLESGVQQKVEHEQSELTPEPKNMFEQCARWCMLGGDIIRQHEDNFDDDGHCEPGVPNCQVCKPNHGFVRRGIVRADKIVAVVEGKQSQEMSKNLSESMDFFNVSRTFTMAYEDEVLDVSGTVAQLIRDPHSSAKVMKRVVRLLDIECLDDATYYRLLNGFTVLQGQNKRVTGPAPTPDVEDGEAYDASEEHFGSPATDTMRAEQTWTPSSNPRAFVEAESPASLFASPPRWLWDKTPNSAASPEHDPEQNAAVTLPPEFLGWKSAGTQVWARLRFAGLEVVPVFNYDLSRVLLKVRCPQYLVEQTAEKMRLRVRDRDGKFTRYRIKKRDSFIRGELDDDIFTSAEQQCIIDYIIKTSLREGGAELDPATPLGSKAAKRFPMHEPKKLEQLKRDWVHFADAKEPHWARFLPDTERSALSVAIVEFVRYCKAVYSGLFYQPLDDVARYYGESVAFYFAWLAFYTRWLVIPSVVGFICFCLQIGSSQLDHPVLPYFGIFIMIWASFLITFWRQKQASLAYRWGTLHFEVEETERPQFKAKVVFDPTTGEKKKVYPFTQRVLRYSVSVPILAGLIFLVLYFMIGIFSTRDELLQNYLDEHESHMTALQVFKSIFSGWGASLLHSADRKETGVAAADADSKDEHSSGIRLEDSRWNDPYFWLVTLFYPSLYGIVLPIFALVFYRVAEFLNTFENHRTESAFINRLILKIFSFRFIVVFLPIFYYALLYDDVEGSYLRVATNVLGMMVAGHWSQVFLDTVLPALWKRWRFYAMMHHVSETRRKITRIKLAGAGGTEGRQLAERRRFHLDQAVSAEWQEELLRPHDLMTDYTMLMLQLGFILCFSVIFPLAPLIALLTNVFMIRIDAYKLCALRRRPIAQKASGIGVWENVLQVMGVIGVICTCGIIALTSDQLSQQFTENTEVIILIMFAVEHAVLLFKYWLSCSVPPLPSSVQRALADRDRKSAPSVPATTGHPPKPGYDSPDPQSRAQRSKRAARDSFIPIIDNDSDQENDARTANNDPLVPQQSPLKDQTPTLDELFYGHPSQALYHDMHKPLQSVQELHAMDEEVAVVQEQPESEQEEPAFSFARSTTRNTGINRRRSPTKRSTKTALQLAPLGAEQAKSPANRKPFR